MENDPPSLPSLGDHAGEQPDLESITRLIVSERSQYVTAGLQRMTDLLRKTREKDSSLAIEYQQHLFDIHILETILTAVKRFCDNEDVLANCFECISELCFGLKLFQQSVWVNNGVDLISDAMKCHPNSVPLQEQALVSLTNICYDLPEVKRYIKEKDGVQLILDTIGVHLGQFSLVAKAFDFLRNVCLIREIQNFIAEKKGVQLRLSAMALHRDCTEVQHICSSFFECLCFNNTTNRQAVIEQGGLRHILFALNHFPASIQVQSRAFKALGVLAYDSLEAIQYIFANQGVDLAMLSLRNHPYQIEVFVSVCKALSVVCFHLPQTQISVFDKDKGSIKQAVIDQGGLGHILFALNHFPASIQVQSRGFTALGVIAYESIVASQYIFANQGVDLAMLSLGNHPDQIEVFVSVCKALSIFCFGMPQTQISVFEKGMVEMGLSFVRTHTGNTAVQASFCKLVTGICCNQPDIQLKFKESGALDIIRSWHHIGIVDVKEAASKALYALNSN